MATGGHALRYIQAILPPLTAVPGTEAGSTGPTPAALDTSDSSSASSGSSVSSGNGPSHVHEDDRINKLMVVLNDESIPEEDKPDQIKDLLSGYLTADSLVDVDSAVLAVLHRHREDVNPTGQTFATGPLTPNKPSLSRSSSFRRNFVPPLGLRHVTPRIPSRPHSPSPLRLQKSTERLDPTDLSPRLLNVTASEFRPRAVSPGPAVWGGSGFSSPLGTPRGYTAPNAADGSTYFPSPTSQKTPGIPKDPWSSASSSNQSLPAQSDSNTSGSSESSFDEPFESFPSYHSVPGLPDVSDDERSRAWMGTDELNSASPRMQLGPPEVGLTGTAVPYSMTPLDHMLSVFGDSGLTTAELENALAQNGWDVDKAVENILLSDRKAEAPGPGSVYQPPTAEDVTRHMGNLDLLRGRGRWPEDGPPTLPGASGRPNVMSRSYNNSPRGSHPGSPRWGSRPGTPSAGQSSGLLPGGGSAYPSAAASNRVCRYYLQGSCLRSDCRYNHDISKAVCRFWLRGHCLKGPDRCDFMHMIPPHLSQDVAALKLRLSQERRNEGYGSDGEAGRYNNGRDEEEEFPTLGAQPNRSRRDPASARWSNAVKTSRAPPPPMEVPSLAGAFGSIGRPLLPTERLAPRIALKPPTLLPTLTTGAKMSETYASYRQRFLDLGAARARCLSKAAEAWKKQDGAGAKYWSREAQAHDLERLQAGREAADQILAERRKLLVAAVRDPSVSRDGKVDLIADRSAKGKEVGGRLGVCLGVVAKGPSSTLSPEERTEVAIDLHGLHAEEATDVLTRFFAALERENFLGTAYLVCGQEKHTVQAQVKVRLVDAVSEFLGQYKYPARLFGGIFAVDPRQHI